MTRSVEVSVSTYEYDEPSFAHVVPLGAGGAARAIRVSTTKPSAAITDRGVARRRRVTAVTARGIARHRVTVNRVTARARVARARRAPSPRRVDRHDACAIDVLCLQYVRRARGDSSSRAQSTRNCFSRAPSDAATRATARRRERRRRARHVLARERRGGSVRWLLRRDARIRAGGRARVRRGVRGRRGSRRGGRGRASGGDSTRCTRRADDDDAGAVVARTGATMRARGAAGATMRARGAADFGDRGESVDAAVGDGDRDVVGADRVVDGGDVVGVGTGAKRLEDVETRRVAST